MKPEQISVKQWGETEASLYKQNVKGPPAGMSGKEGTLLCPAFDINSASLPLNSFYFTQKEFL
ncbi:MAG: hypothetical protein ACK4E0_07335 [Chitinophagaceae bacterium]